MAADAAAPMGGLFLNPEHRSSKVWKDNVSTDAHGTPFARKSVAVEDNEDAEALMWAALEEFPAYERLRMVFLNEEEKVPVDVRYLSRGERQRVLESAFATTDQDNLHLLQRLKERLQRVRIALPTVEVRFEHLRISADVHVGSRALPSLTNFVRNFVEDMLVSMKIMSSDKKDFKILKDVSGVIKPGRMTLLLGPPGAGKSTLLVALAGKLEADLRATGTITYNGHGFNEFEPLGTSAYIGQEDNHIGEMTVRETLDFSARCQGVGYKNEMLTELVGREKERHIHPDPEIDAFMKAMAVKGKKHSMATDYMMKVLGLEVCADTLVGNEMLRGVSGGQKKRVTTGEMVVGPKKTLFMDEISTGLDSSTTFQIVKCVRNFVHLLEGTVLMALLQPPPETYDLFDDVLLLAEGYVVYLGPRESILHFFELMGFKLPPRKGVADFLQEVTSKKDQKQYWADKSRPYQYIPVAVFAEAFQDYQAGKDLSAHLATPYNKAGSHPAALSKRKYAMSSWELFKACTQREILLISRHRFLYIFKTTQVAIMAIITGTLFLRTTIEPTNEIYGNMYLGCLFFALIHMMFNGFSEMAITVHRLPVFYKQRDNRFYPAWAFSLPSWFLRIPYSVVEAVIWSCIIYYCVGFTPEADRFFRYMFLLMLMHQMALAIFRLIGALARDMVVANTFGSFALLIVFLLGGFIIARNDIHPWWIWGYWLSPLSYSQNAIAVNEFLAPRWNQNVATGYRKLYINIMKPRGLFLESWWYWVGVGVLTGYMLLFNLVVILAFAYLDPLGKPQAVIPEDPVEPPSVEAAVPETATKRTFRSDGTPEMTLDVAALEKRDSGKKKGMILPFQPLSLTFLKMCYYVDMPAEMRSQGLTDARLQLLRNVSGAFRPGVLTALVGVSGAGKTTLMDVLAGRKTGGYIEGDIRVSGYSKVQKTFARISGYVEQTDIHSPQVTVYESLLYSSWLRLPREVNKTTRYAFVEEIMSLVELDTLRNALVGLPGSTGLSTEQRKRLTIAVELVANPSIIFMDEPTSGLDARAAAIVMRTVRNTVDTGRTVVCTIHQPSIDIFEAFDELLLMKRGGRVIYMGPLGENSQTMIDYFMTVEGVPIIKDGYNPATWMLEVTSPAAEARLKKDFADIYSVSDLHREIEELIEELSVPPPSSRDLSFPTEYSQDSMTQFKACLWKQNLTYWRSPNYNAVRFFFTLICALIFGSVFWDIGSKRGSQQDLFNVMGALYAAVLFLGINNASSVQPIVSVERTVFYRERAAGMYSPLPYAFAQGAIEIPYLVLQTIIYGLVTYSMIHFEWTAAKFFWYLLFMFLTFTYFTVYGMMAIGLTPSQQLAAVISSAFYSLWNLFSGFIIPQPLIPGWWVWFYWISPIAWTLYGLIGSQLGDVKERMTAQGYGTIQVDVFLRHYFGFRHDWLGYCVAVLIAYIVVFWFGFAYSIKYINFQKR
ncbi:ABC transporter G family member 31 [Selaginella moellendorffii]|uniref:ABC transporter G family member 31 n=1 Tax=Selaginella moellendorffii TaxID=88036 RepID=UPI000D1CFEF5|nr:ABC transporter G family member 31 [Selaginella moellendorffii]|eukprot:XP_024516623.1 ABC transporter G family member 31 [Selaginella moellendorffii]